jgi:predicted transcriptional regulator of viral defense system
MSTSLDAIYPFAESQGGHFTASQAHDVRVSDQQLHYLYKSGSIQRMAHGIYRLQRFPSHPFEDVIVATLWAGDEAAASHDTALVIYRLTDAMPPVIHLTLPRAFRGKRKGVVVHTAPLRDDEKTRRESVPVTSPARTIRDIAARYGAEEAVEAAVRAVETGVITRARLSKELEADADMLPLLELLSRRW